MVLRADARKSLDDVILQVFETEDDTFFFPVTSQKSARAFVKALHIRGIDYGSFCREIDEFEHNFTSWRTGLGRPGIGNRVIERINRPVHELLLQLAEDEEEDRKTFTQLEKYDVVASSDEDAVDGLVCLGRVRFEPGPSPSPAGKGSPLRGRRPVAAKNLPTMDGKDVARDESSTPTEVDRTCAEINHKSVEEKEPLENGTEDRIGGTAETNNLVEIDANPKAHKDDSPSNSKSDKDGESQKPPEQVPLVKTDQVETILERKSSEVGSAQDLVAVETKPDGTKAVTACGTAENIASPEVPPVGIKAEDTKVKDAGSIHSEHVETLSTANKLHAEVIPSGDKSPPEKVPEKVGEETEIHQKKSGSVSGDQTDGAAQKSPDVITGKKNADIKADVTTEGMHEKSPIVSPTEKISTANNEVSDASVKTKAAAIHSVGKPENGDSARDDVKLSLARSSSSTGTDVSAENRQMTVNHVTRRSPRRIRMKNTESDEEKDAANPTSDGKLKTAETPPVVTTRTESTEEQDIHFQQLQQGKPSEDSTRVLDLKKDNVNSAETNATTDRKLNGNNETAIECSKQTIDCNGSVTMEVDETSNRNSAEENDDDDDDDVVGENYESDRELESQVRKLRKCRIAVDGPGYVYAFTDSRNDATDFRMKIAASRNPCGRLEQAKRFNVDIRLVSAIQVSARRTAAKAIHDCLKDLALTGSVDWFVGGLDDVIGAMMDVGRLYPVEP